MKVVWSDQRELRNIEKPAAVVEYERRLQQALLWHGKLDRFSSFRPKPGSVVTNRAAKAAEIKNKCDRAFEDTYEHLQEIFAADPTVQLWFDRDLDFSFDTHINIDPDSMPRVITSRSANNMGDAKSTFGFKSKKEVKLDALRSALGELENELLGDKERKANAEKDAEMARQLKNKLAKLKTTD